MSRILRRLAGLVLAFLALFGGPALATPAGDLPALLAMPRSGDLTGARDAERFAWVTTEAGVRAIWIGGPGDPARKVWSAPADDGVTVSALALDHGGRRLAFVRGGDPEWADMPAPNAGAAASPPPQQVILLDLAGSGRPVVLGEGHSPVFARDGAVAFTIRGRIMLAGTDLRAQTVAQVPGTVTNLQFSPDGTRLLFVEQRGDHAFAALVTRDGQRVRYLSPGFSVAADPVFSPDGSKVAFIRYRDPPPRGDNGNASYWSIAVADVAGEGERPGRTVWQAPGGRGGRYAGTRQQNLYWTADDRLVFPWERDGWLHVYAMPAGGGNPVALTAGAFEVETFVLDGDSRSVLFVANAGDSERHALWRAPPGQPARRVTRSNAIESYPALAGKAFAFIQTDERRPAHVALADGKALGPVAAVRGGVTPRAVSFTAADGMQVRGQLFEGAGAGPRPAVVFLHGGPRRQMLTGFHPAAYYSNTYAFHQYLAARGVTILSVNYRSGTGYGLAFRDAPDTGREGAAEYRDVLAAGRWLAARDDVDSARIGVWGGSWGGYLAALALARDSDLFRAGVDFHGVHSMLRAVPDSLSPAEQEQARRLQWESSPLAAIETWRSPVLLVHGDDDRNVAFRQSMMLARELAARGIPFEELVFPGERHSFLRHESWVHAMDAAAEFLERNLKGPRP
ncbi:prolyl oligopeptidase family serine peptidase [Altererythrobacter aerius]|uniref:Acyl-peptide hydrolase n=1 Tax=Tsuneonella aeria TaxID=1837929 RepID=A0A6I4TFD5_9SPHN|nr:prolyl oligopeptidase family serine peptidase [Tsuneonella aeria]MXO76031.1 prolyl oligopeptidase family serine peptidase [Tsuneonella aeria]